MTTRRSFFAAGFGTLGLTAISPAQPPIARKGRLKQSATRGCFGRGIAFEDVCREAARLGLKGLDLIGPNDWPTLKKYGLLSTMAPSAGHSLTNGINTKENHPKAEAGVREVIDKAAAFGCPNVIVLSGNRRGMTDEQGIENCVSFLNSVKAQAEDKGVTICMELLNSKVDHRDYQCDHTAWGVEVCKRVNSPRVKLLYDIYHMQIMEGDIIRTIRDNIQYIGHFHTAGNPGRHEIDSSQELNYRAIAQAVVETGYTGYFAHEYGPLRDPLKSMAEAIEICDV
jgi:hydroxypyruvate isomerase